MNKWRECKLGDIFSVKHGFAFKGEFITDSKNKNILVTPGNFHIGGGFKSDKFKYYSSEDFPKDYILSADDIVVTMTDLSKDSDTLGYSAKIPKSDKNKYLHNQRIGLLQFVNTEFDSDFIYWLLRTRDYQGYIVGSASGTSIMHTSPSRIESYVCLIPPLPEQKAIAGVLSSLDDKIDLLHHQNKTLEAIAEALFRQWFVEETDEGWEVGSISHLVSIQNGFAFKGADFKENGSNGVIKIKNISGGMINIETTDFIEDSVIQDIDRRFKIESGDILIAMTGAEIGKLGIIPSTNKSLWLNQRVGLLKENVKGAKYLAYLQLRSEHGQDYIKNTATGSAQPNISTSGIENCEFPILDSSFIKNFSLQIDELYTKIIFNLGLISTLEKLRDTLLPKLMSGEVRVAV